MKRLWLLFSQTATVLLAAYFVVATLKPDWLGRSPNSQTGSISLLEAPATSSGSVPAGSFRLAAQKSSAAVVSINTSKGAKPNPNSNDPWFKFFFGDQGSGEPQVGLGSGVIVSPSGYILTATCSTVNAKSPGFVIYGHKATLNVADQGQSFDLLPERWASEEVEPMQVKGLQPEDIRVHEKNWFDCIRSGKAPNGNIESPHTPSTSRSALTD